MKLRAKDIAKQLGVSTATMSLVINNKPGVSDKRRQEIIEKIKEMGCDYLLYKGENTESKPAHKGSVGFVVYKRVGSIVEESPFFNYILKGISERIIKYGYNLTFIYMDKSMSVEEQLVQINNSDCLGLLIFGVEMQKIDLDAFKQSGLPFVIIDNSFPESDVDAIAINNTLGIIKAVDYLFENGHRRIGYLKSKERINSFNERRSAFKKRLKTLEIKEYREDIIEVGYSEHSIKDELAQYFRDNNEKLPTAFFAENDYIACNAMVAFQEAGYKVPEDVSIIGFDNRPITEMVEPNVTTMNVPKDIFGPEAVELLMSRLEKGRKQSVKIAVGTELMIRESVKNVKQ